MDKKALKNYAINLESKTLDSFIKIGYSKIAAENMKRMHKKAAKNIRKYWTKTKNDA